MAVDVVTERTIHRDPAEVASFASDPHNAPLWYANIESVEWKSDPPLRIGTEIDFVARFLGRRLAYTYEVTELIDGERLVMQTQDGPFPMETTYEFFPTDSGGTRMVLRNQGEPAGFSRISAPVVARAMRRANERDLAELARLVEAGAA